LHFKSRDIEGEEKLFGKKRGTDLKNGKVTLPLIFALKQVNGSLRNKIIKKVKKKASRTDVKAIIRFIQEQGGIQYAAETAERLAREAQEELSVFESSEYKTSMLNLAEYMVHRKK